MPSTLSNLPAIALRTSANSDAFHAHQAEIEPGFVALGRQLAGMQAAASPLLLQGGTDAAPPQPGFALKVGAFREHVAVIAYHIQFGDIIRQKHEHVVAALGDIARWLAAASPQLDAHLRATEADCLIALQSSQLTAIRHDVVFVGQRLREHFAAIERLARSAETAGIALTRSACEAPAGLAFLDKFAADLDGELEALETVRDSLQPWLITGLDLSELLARYEKRYTTIAEWERNRLSAGPAAGEAVSDAGDVSFF